MQEEENFIDILLDIEEESLDWFPPLELALGDVNSLIKHYEVRSSHTTSICY